MVEAALICIVAVLLMAVFTVDVALTVMVLCVSPRAMVRVFPVMLVCASWPELTISHVTVCSGLPVPVTVTPSVKIVPRARTTGAVLTVTLVTVV